MNIDLKFWDSKGKATIDIQPGDFFSNRLKSGKMSAPKMPRKNKAYIRDARGGNVLAPEHRHFRDLVRAEIRRTAPETSGDEFGIKLSTTFGRERKISGSSFPGMDASATLEAVCDAIQSDKRDYNFRGLVHDDAQITSRSCDIVYCKGLYWLTIKLYRLRARQ